ncbi:MAG: hypothetical protein D3921_01615 [Candidatus Electrothrix sp. AW1]|nr:hypothetical protein [Candidatus Electrothrix sp. AX1]MCI5181223.1 hypothetical protein [Candidatus Electrothrix gigas]
MKKMAILGMTAALFAIGLGSELQAGAILDPENLTGTVGLSGQTFNSGYVYASWAEGSAGMELGSGSPQNFSLWVEKSKPVNLDIDMYSFAGTSDAYLRQSIKGIDVNLLPGSPPYIDLERDSGRIEGTVTVASGGTVKSINMSSSVQINAGSSVSGYDESYRGLVRATGSVAEQPMPAANDIQVYGTAILHADAGCDVPVDFASQSVNLPNNTTKQVDWSFTLGSDACDLGRIYGDIELKGLDSQSLVPDLNYHRVYVYKSPTFKKRELKAGPPSYSASYNFPGLVDGNYDVDLINYFKPPYGFISFQEDDSVVNSSSVQHDFIKSVGTLHGEVKPEGFWGLDDLGRMIIGFRQGTMNQPLDSQDDADLSTGQFDLVVPENDSYLYVDYFAFKNKSNGCRLFRQEAQRNYYGQSWSPFSVSIVEGDNLTGDLEVEASLVNQEFHLSDLSVGIKRLDLKGKEITKSGYLWVKEKRIESLSNLTGAGTPTNSVIVPLRGTPGIYNMTAEADGTDGKVYGSSFKLELTAPEEYTGSPSTFSTSTGGAVSVDFDSGSGYTNVGVSTMGPVFGAFKVVENTGDKSDIYYDIHSNVPFDKTNPAEVCFQVPPSMTNPQIAHYVCSGTCGSSCKWELLQNQTTKGTQRCGETSSFSIFTVVEPLVSDYTVVPLAGSGGSISPDSSQKVDEGDTTSFTVTPDSKYHIDSVEGCEGSLDGNIYTTGAITADCMVKANFEINSYSVTSSAGEGGSISPNTAQSVEYGKTTDFEVVPATGYSIGKVEGCGGTLVGSTYTTGAITEDCEVTASFVINTYTVTPSAGANGSISPDSNQTVNYGDTTSFTLTPDSGYGIDTVGGCNGSLNGNIYTTSAITGDCTVTANFITAYTVIPKVRRHGSISPNTPQQVSEGHTVSFTVTPDDGYSIRKVRGCGGSLDGNIYTTGPITRKCRVTASFKKNPVVTAKARRHGSIAPSGPQSVSPGTILSFTVTPNVGYSIKNVRGCSGTLSGNSYTTAPITQKCRVRASFRRD